ncbi:hypothetical protein HanRHA438_Chr06g0276771 [Helianthus annuus]|nr:hypothetical protein HanRHA438_Chr06g0276771 [Helianthus annuus]
MSKTPILWSILAVISDGRSNQFLFGRFTLRICLNCDAPNTGFFKLMAFC